MREYFEECENPETCGESFGEKWGRLRRQLVERIDVLEKENDPERMFEIHKVLRMMDNIEFCDA